jgi:D-serine deaminase-like pyridoxal phosphate-dependent protein
MIASQNKYVQDLDTPVLLVDIGRLDANIQGMQSVAAQAGAALRPHIKTHKSLAVATRQLNAGANALTCQKLGEAEIMSEVCEDLFISYPVVGAAKLARLVQLSEKCRTLVAVESWDGAQQIHSYYRPLGWDQEVMIELDTGLHRTGVTLEELETFLYDLSELNHLKPIGIFTHEGHAYRQQGRPALQQVLNDVADQLKTARAIFHTVFGRQPVISPGCTLTAPLVTPAYGFDELRPGSYVYKDTICMDSEMYEESECALTALTQVIAVKKDGRVVVDAGTKTLTSDRTPTDSLGTVVGHRYLVVEKMTEEHGILKTPQPDQYRVGQLLEIIPAHVCPAVNLHNHVVARDGDQVIEIWPVDARGCVR